MKNQEIEIPKDLLMSIGSRVPAKSVVRFRCVSKFWESIFCHPEFTEYFSTMSWTRPQLILFTIVVDGKFLFFSSPLPQNPCDENITSLVPTRYHVHNRNTPPKVASYVGSPLGGFICCRDSTSKGTIFICNPATKESVWLPEVSLKINTDTSPYLGYDPMEKQLKVLCIKFGSIPNPCDEHQVLTLGKGNPLWRTIQCKPHYPKSAGVCIDGILYYTAGFDRGKRVSMIVCFDVRSEKFSFIDIDKCMWMTSSCTLINYKGKLGALQFTSFTRKRFELWVLDDAEKYIWSSNIYTLPPLWESKAKYYQLGIVGMTSGGGEVVLAPYCLAGGPFYIYYFNLERESLVRFQIQGLEMFKPTRVYTSLDYAENLTECDRGVYTFSSAREAKSATEASKLSEPNLSNKEKGTASCSVLETAS